MNSYTTVFALSANTLNVWLETQHLSGESVEYVVSVAALDNK